MNVIVSPDGGASLSSGSCAAGLEGDEALALRLQLQMDQEAAEAQAADLEDGGLFFCQICQRDLSHMNPEGRTHHLNRSKHLFHVLIFNTLEEENTKCHMIYFTDVWMRVKPRAPPLPYPLVVPIVPFVGRSSSLRRAAGPT